MQTQSTAKQDINLPPKNLHNAKSTLDFVSANKIKEAASLVDTLDFTKLNSKLINHYGWDKVEVSTLNSLYKEWLVLHICYPHISLTPNIKLDEYWHMHILDTKAYAKDCLLLFGEFLHHYPYFGLEDNEEEAEMTFDLTNDLFFHHFGHTQSTALASCKSSKCESSKCKSSSFEAANCKSDVNKANCKSNIKASASHKLDTESANYKSSSLKSANCKSTKSANCKSQTLKQANCKSSKANCKSTKSANCKSSITKA
ncbi:hypothetical protein [Helicobacter sp. 11S02629-2]|uniref:glycine-rich domain-containing protein n=1 Tax=Helicobacter sp. 11S02629-2 TaxID=1476195 RepID=UPI000BA58569|nr:hypothetical protein [Helicobacter sp. 11S02629-2]PAF44077.1 hypothetical protein BKH40_06305 [Helicobacter sp. 11S02629-2]